MRKVFFMLKITCFVLFIFSFAACKTKPAKSADILLGEGKGVFRNIQFDIDVETAKSNETATLVNSAEDYLRYEIKNIQEKPSQYAEIEYHFNSKRLDLITVYYNVATQHDIEPLFNDIKAFYVKKFGNSSSNKSGWETWSVEDREGMPGTIEVMLRGVNENGLFGVDIELVKYYKDEQKQAQLVPMK